MSSFEKKTLDDGSTNPKYIDLCDEDPAIAGQKFACMSFVSPEKILKKREVYLFDQFIKNWDFSKSMASASSSGSSYIIRRCHNCFCPYGIIVGWLHKSQIKTIVWIRSPN